MAYNRIGGCLMNAMIFEKTFEKWLADSLKACLPKEIKAFSFNLFELSSSRGIKFGIELVGTGTFDENNQDWACDEIWEPIERKLFIPESYSTLEWEVCLIKIKTLIENVLKSNSDIAEKLEQKEAVAIGFVDGDLQLIYLRKG